MITLSPDTMLAVPENVAVCPYCQSSLYVSVEGWDQDDEGAFLADCVILMCEQEPTILANSDEYDYDDYDEWYELHSELPYAYWLPVETKVKAWLNDNYRWELE